MQDVLPGLVRTGWREDDVESVPAWLTRVASNAEVDHSAADACSPGGRPVLGRTRPACEAAEDTGSAPQEEGRAVTKTPCAAPPAHQASEGGAS